MRHLQCPDYDLNFKYTLSGGQSFRWKEVEPGIWFGVFGHKVWKFTRYKDGFFYRAFRSEKDFRKINSEKAEDEMELADEEMVINYLRLNKSLKPLYEEWSNADPNFSKLCKKFTGIRILKQDPVENIFSFICSSNNFIARISSMIEKLCTFYGEKLCVVGGVTYYDFPKLEALAKPGVDEELRKAGFGYRASYISKSAELIVNFGGELWLNQLQRLSYAEAKTELMKLHGVGAKVADCICLMSLGHLEAIPVDTHVFQIASQYYMPRLKSSKSLTTKIYDEIGHFFRTLYGPYAGWAHTILFCADLKKFQEKSITNLKRKDMTVEKYRYTKTARSKY